MTCAQNEFTKETAHRSPGLRRLAEDVYVAHHPHRILGWFPIGHRMTVVKLRSGGLVLISPVPLDNFLVEELRELGSVEHVMAPSLFHNLFLERYVERYPHAKFWAAPEFAAHNPRARVDATLDDRVDLPDLRVAVIRGMPKVNECVVLHEPSRSLIVADLVFHFPTSDSLPLRMLLRLVGAYGRVRASRLFRSMIKDRSATRSSIEDVLCWDFDRLIVGHGEVVEHDGGALLRAAYSRLLGTPR